MIDEVIKSLKAISNIETTKNHADFPKEGYKPIEIDKKNFHTIAPKALDQKIAFIDGGNSEILKAPNFSLQLIRVCYVIYQNNKHLESKKQEMFTLTTSINKDGKISYQTKIISKTTLIDDKNLLFDSFDKTLVEGINRASISKIGSVIRRFLEIKTATLVLEKLGKADIIVIDGNLQATITNEELYLDELYEKAIQKDVIISALSKTSNLLTKKGQSLHSILLSIAPSGCWYYYPLVEINNLNHKAEIFFIKLNNNSKHIFRFEISNKQKEHSKAVLEALASNSNDPIFLGYPYGLIKADKQARVSNKEITYLKTLITTRLGKSWNNLKQLTTAIDAHDILDNIS